MDILITRVYPSLEWKLAGYVDVPQLEPFEKIVIGGSLHLGRSLTSTSSG